MCNIHLKSKYVSLVYGFFYEHIDCGYGCVNWDKSFIVCINLTDNQRGACNSILFYPLYFCSLE